MHSTRRAQALAGRAGTAAPELKRPTGVRPHQLHCLLAAALSACTLETSSDGGGGQGGADGGPGSRADGGADGDSCGEETRWTCDGEARTRCDGAAVEREECERGCLDPASAEGDAHCIAADPAWDCESSDHQGEQYWTCDAAAGELHRCDREGGTVVRCADGCIVGPLGTDDACRTPGGTAIPLPQITFVIGGGLFAESAVRAPVEAGVAYMLERIADHIEVPAGATVPDITIYYSPSGNTYCSGLAHADSTEIACPAGYPITGDNQNFVVNITIHEIGHIAARALIAPPSARDNCENEGVATWMAGRYWMNAASSPVASLRVAARREIAAGRAVATMSDCILASDPYYKVYGSYFEYLEGFPGAIEAVASGAVPSGEYVAGWQAWLAE